MTVVAVVIGIVANCVVFIPVGLLFAEVLLAATSKWPPERDDEAVRRDGAFAVIVPAHNEGANLISTLRDVRGQLAAGDRLVVVADNCADDTAEIAAREGAEVVERSDPSRKGKGYALERGVQHLCSAPPDVAIVVDADCRLEDGALERLCAAAEATGRPAQAFYSMRSATGASVNRQVAEFAWSLKNLVRPLGLSALGLPCHLMGSGMAFPWSVISSAELGTDNVVEDLKLGIELALERRPPIFCPDAEVVSYFPDSEAAAEGQRKRWEQGHVALFLTVGLPLLPRAIVERNRNLLGLLLDLAIPPASMLVAALLTLACASLVLFFVSGGAAPLLLSGVDILIFVAAIGLAWARFGRQILPINAVLSILPYMVKKFVLYARMLRHRGPLEWNRTERDGSSTDSR
jgi:cellulose synthase/poly-beta-1,6-N-acetylglucosamine synthase-like glycosyltransferase